MSCPFTVRTENNTQDWVAHDRLEKLQLEAARIVEGLTVYSSRDSLYQETGWGKIIK
jgi:hypothetical protein